MRILTVPGVFRPRSDSLLLAARVHERVRPGDRVLDPFTGSGVLAVAAALAGGEVTAVDISRPAVACAWLNGRLNGVRIRARRGDMFVPVATESFDLVIANPPYLPGAAGAQPRGAARAWEGGGDGRRLLDRFCAEVPRRLAPGGRVLLVHSDVCDPEATESQLRAGGLDVEVLDRRTGPLGPLLADRAPMLERREVLRPGQREEEMLVFGAWRTS
jgi:release factor glutamine methyltransferase